MRDKKGENGLEFRDSSNKEQRAIIRTRPNREKSPGNVFI